MSKELLIELFGYLGSFLVLVSFITTSVVKLRIINTIGSIIFMIYAFIIKSYPTAVMNGALVLINIHYLWKMMKDQKEYDVIKIAKDDPIVSYFMNYYKADFDKYFSPSDLDECNLIYLSFCEGKPVGLTAGIRSENDYDLKVDYTTAEYRDFSIGSRVYQEIKEDGIKNVIFNCNVNQFVDYLKKFGFVYENDKYIKHI